ncbi:hypothetical protein BC749_10360 [Flavobacterium araucananum]|uniref:Lipoprotein n=1 Tax=Flavobacterium araucananum TaxID=946678 RepID=A0A227PH33_9FLAO|nr:hypothetical protein [Flavobacterium araucananum]OXG09122.1 hypothetical protein B0A64_03770 [Flavobacterium araucananum]PWJ99682.1 hypothetical protein BC749_10360 [Flavobacterium araucananum]
MDISKLNKVVLIFLILISCNNKDHNNCDSYIAAGEGFWISFKNYSKEYSQKDLENLKIQINSKDIKYTKEDLKDYLYQNNYNIGVSEKVLLKDTMVISIKSKIIKIYDFTNIVEEGFDQSHNKIRVCRYCKSTVNNQKMEDYGNNIIIIDLEKY